MHKPLQAALVSLSEEFKRAAAFFPPLYHERVYDLIRDGKRLTDGEAAKSYNSWRSLKRKGQIGQWWHGPHKTAFGNIASPEQSEIGGYTGPAGEWYGRFYGSIEGLDEFRRLAETAYIVISELELPILVVAEGWVGFMEGLYQVAVRRPTPFIRVVGARKAWVRDHWRHRDNEAEDDSMAEDHENTMAASAQPPTAETFPMPFVESLRHSVFTASISAIQLLLHPESMLLLDEGGYSPDEDFAPVPLLTLTSVLGRFDEWQPQLKQMLVSPEPDVPKSDYRFCYDKKAGRWHLKFRVNASTVEEGWFDADLGFFYYASILDCCPMPMPCSELSRDGKEVDSTTLARLEESNEGTTPTDFAHDPTETRAAKRRFRRSAEYVETRDWLRLRKQQLEDEVIKAKDSGSDRLPQLQKELKDIRDLLQLGGTPRGSSADEKARRRVKQRLRGCREKIGQRMPQLKRYLTNSVKLDPSAATAAYLYQPSLRLDWDIELPD